MRTLLLVAALLLLSACGGQPVSEPPSLVPATPLPQPEIKPDGSCNCAPKAIRIASIKVAADHVGTVGLQKNGTMEVPPLSKAKEIDWYRYSPVPGDLGPSVIISHVDGDGQQGGFAALGKVQVGDTVDVERTDGLTATFKVIKTALVPKDQMGNPDQVHMIYGDTVDPELRLITCGGVLDKIHHNYLSNRVVFASLSDLKKTVS